MYKQEINDKDSYQYFEQDITSLFQLYEKIPTKIQSQRWKKFHANGKWQSVYNDILPMFKKIVNSVYND